jgi:putative intracellular protease/amidase
MSEERAPLVGVYAAGKGTMTRDIFPVLVHFEFRFRTLEKDDLRTLKTGDVDVLLFPGGWYFFDNDPEIVASVRDFVSSGGGYVGICCGAINAMKLGLLDTDMINMDGMGPCTVEPVDGEHPVLKDVAKKSDKSWRPYDKIQMLRYNGWPMLLKAGAHMIAAYDADKKVAAIACAEYGKGRVVAFSPHPEGATCEPGIFRDRDELPLVYDGIKMGTARMLDNALRWCVRTPHA